MMLEQGLKPAVGGPGLPIGHQGKETFADPQTQREDRCEERYGQRLSPLPSCEATSWAFQNAVKQARHSQGVVLLERLMPPRVFPKKPEEKP